MAKIETILLGDNPFFGVDHLSQERARQKAAVSQNLNNIVSIVKKSIELGCNGFVLSTRYNTSDFIGRLKNEGITNKIKFYPIILSPTNYMQKILEKGMVNGILDIISDISMKRKLKLILHGGIGILKKDPFDILKAYMDLELGQMKDVKIEIVFLHEVLTDLIIALDLKKVLKTYCDYLNDQKITAGVVTKNFPLLVSKLKEWEIPIKNVMTSFNKTGFQMNPTKEQCEKSLISFNGNIIAMSTMASGYLDYSTALEYISSLQKINTITVGVSSITHLKEIFEKTNVNK